MRFKDLPICVIVKGNCLEWYTWINLKSNGSQIFCMHDIVPSCLNILGRLSNYVSKCMYAITTP